MIGHIEEGRRIDKAMCGSAQTFAIKGVELVDARGVIPHSWVSIVDGAIDASGTFDDDLATHIEMMGGADHIRVIDGQEAWLAPGYVDIHAHGAWECSFDDGADAIAVARAWHMNHGTTRQVLSLITNPLDVMCANLAVVARETSRRPDVLGAHLEGPFLALGRTGVSMASRPSPGSPGPV